MFPIRNCHRQIGHW